MQKGVLGILYGIICVGFCAIAYFIIGASNEKILPLLCVIITGLAGVFAALINSSKNSEPFAKGSCHAKICKKGLDYYPNREASGLVEQFKRIKANAEVTILCVTLKQVCSLLRDPEVRNHLENTKAKITIYALDINDSIAITRIHKFFSESTPEEMKSEMERWYTEFKKDHKLIDPNIFELHFFSTQKDDVPLPTFQLYAINEFFYINPLVSVNIPLDNTDTLLQNDEREKTTLKHGLHLRFQTDKSTEGVLTEYKNALKYYKEHSHPDHEKANA